MALLCKVRAFLVHMQRGNSRACSLNMNMVSRITVIYLPDKVPNETIENM